MQPGGWFLIALAVLMVIGIIGSKKTANKDDSDKK